MFKGKHELVSFLLGTSLVSRNLLYLINIFVANFEGILGPIVGQKFISF